LPTGGVGTFEWKSREGNDSTFAALSIEPLDKVIGAMKNMVGDNPLVVFEE
jgi:hypothetical protein